MFAFTPLWAIFLAAALLSIAILLGVAFAAGRAYIRDAPKPLPLSGWESPPTRHRPGDAATCHVCYAEVYWLPYDGRFGWCNEPEKLAHGILTTLHDCTKNSSPEPCFFDPWTIHAISSLERRNHAHR